jgi:hypothetical protein
MKGADRTRSAHRGDGFILDVLTDVDQKDGRCFYRLRIFLPPPRCKR